MLALRGSCLLFATGREIARNDVWHVFIDPVAGIVMVMELSGFIGNLLISYFIVDHCYG